MQTPDYQYGFSEQHSNSMYDVDKRTRKATKMLSVVTAVCGDLSTRSLLDIGCSTGIMTRVYGTKFARVVGIDIDEPAVQFAVSNYSCDNVTFLVRSADSTGFDDESFDVVSCTHIYEHVPDSGTLMSEIYRLLKPGGICYFVAGNRLLLIEGHYRLPLLSVIPKPLAHLYLRALGRGNRYYENHLTLWGLRQLVSRFEVIDFTTEIVRDPRKYSATEMLPPNSFRQKIALAVLNVAYFLFPTYVWVLRKPLTDS